MSNQWFNVRFGKYHWQLTNTWQLDFSKNHYWDQDPWAYQQVRWFQVYCAFGRHF